MPIDKQEDVVAQARAIIANHQEGRVFVLTVPQYDALPELLKALADEVETLRKEVQLCRQVKKRGKHSSVMCECVIAMERTTNAK